MNLVTDRVTPVCSRCSVYEDSLSTHTRRLITGDSHRSWVLDTDTLGWTESLKRLN